MAYLDGSRRVGRSQGAVIFWGLVSAFFAAAFCYYFLKNRENETSSRQLGDEVLNLQEQRDMLSSQKDKLQSDITQTEAQLKTREEFLQDKETKLAVEESQIEAQGRQSQNVTQQNQAETVMVKRFNDEVRKLAKGDTDVVVRGGRPVLRVPAAIFFSSGDTDLKPEGGAMLKQIAQSLDGLNNFELRVETFTDSDGEAGKSAADTPSVPADAAKPKSRHASWDLTARRAATIGRFLHDQTSLPFQNVIVDARADLQPIAAGGKEGRTRNRRVEITIAPQPPSFHPPDVTPDRSDAGSKAEPPAPVDPLAPPPDKPVKAKNGD